MAIFICCICIYTLVDIMPELKRHILNTGYGITLKYEEMLSYPFDRFYVVTKFYFTSHQRPQIFTNKNLIQIVII